MSRASATRLALLACLWGSSFLFIKVALDGLSPIQIVLARMTTGALVLLAIVAARHEQLPRGRSTWAHIAVAAVVGNLIPYFLFGWGEQRVDSSVAGTLNATTPRVHARDRLRDPHGDHDHARARRRLPGRLSRRRPDRRAVEQRRRHRRRRTRVSRRRRQLLRLLRLHAPVPHQPRHHPDRPSR